MRAAAAAANFITEAMCSGRSRPSDHKIAPAIDLTYDHATHDIYQRTGWRAGGRCLDGSFSVPDEANNEGIQQRAVVRQQAAVAPAARGRPT